MDTAEVLNYINKANKFIISSGPPKFIGDAQWVDISSIGALTTKIILSEEEKDKLRSLHPLDLPLTTQRFKCPIENKEISLGLYYYDLDGWILNSTAIHFIVNHDIELPVGLVEKIKELNLTE